MSADLEIKYSYRWESKKISEESKIYNASSPDMRFQAIAFSDKDESYKTNKVDSQKFYITLGFQDDSHETDTQPISEEIYAENFDTLSQLRDLISGLGIVDVTIEDNILILQSPDQPFTIHSQNEEDELLIEALGLHPVESDS